MSDYADEVGQPHGVPAGRWPVDDVPPHSLRITAPGFAPDIFQFSGLYYVSAPFRYAADKAGANAQYVPVDMSGCTPEAHAKDYKVLNVIDGVSGEEPDSDAPIALRAPGPRYLYCSDAFAAAMLRAGLEGVEFFEPSGDGGIVRTTRRPASL